MCPDGLELGQRGPADVLHGLVELAERGQARVAGELIFELAPDPRAVGAHAVPGRATVPDARVDMVQLARADDSAAVATPVRFGRPTLDILVGLGDLAVAQAGMPMGPQIRQPLSCLVEISYTS